MRLHPDLFFEYPATVQGKGFRKNNIPTEQTFRDLFDSLVFPLRSSDAAKTDVSGLVRLATYAEVESRAYDGAWPKIALVSALPDIIVDSTGHTEISVLGPSEGLTVTKYKEDAKNKVDYLLEVAVKNSIVIDADELMLVGDSAAPGANKYYGTDGSEVKGYHSFSVMIDPLSLTDDTISINPAWYAVIEGTSHFDLKGIRILAHSLELPPVTNSTSDMTLSKVVASHVEGEMKRHSLMLSSGGNTTDGTFHDGSSIYLYGATSTGAGDIHIRGGVSHISQVGANVYIYPGWGSDFGNVITNFLSGSALGKMGIGIDPASESERLQVSGSVRADKYIASSIAAVADMDEVTESGAIVVVNSSTKELKTATYSQLESMLTLAGGDPHNLLSATHEDTNPANALIGAIITGQNVDGAAKWGRLAKGDSGNVLMISGDNVVWGIPEDIGGVSPLVVEENVVGFNSDWYVPGTTTQLSFDECQVNLRRLHFKSASSNYMIDTENAIEGVSRNMYINGPKNESHEARWEIHMTSGNGVSSSPDMHILGGRGTSTIKGGNLSIRAGGAPNWEDRGDLILGFATGSWSRRVLVHRPDAPLGETESLNIEGGTRTDTLYIAKNVPDSFRIEPGAIESTTSLTWCLLMTSDGYVQKISLSNLKTVLGI